jgi:hypothetical protein
MAQTTAAISRAGFEVEVSTDGASWTDISGQAASVTVSGGDQVVGEQLTADGGTPVVTGTNKIAARTVTVRAVYTETNGEAWETVKTRYDGTAKTIYLRWAPKSGIGTVVGNNVFTCTNTAGTTIAVPIVTCQIPELDAASGDPALFEFSVLTPNITESASTTS